MGTSYNQIYTLDIKYMYLCDKKVYDFMPLEICPIFLISNLRYLCAKEAQNNLSLYKFILKNCLECNF